MNKFFIPLHGLLILLSLFCSTTYASYSMTELEATALDVPDSINTVVWDNTDTGYPDDDDKQTVAIGFPFQFDNTLYNNVTILTNGILKFGAIERMHRDYRNEELDTNEGDRFIAVYWDDLVDDASSSVTYGNSGTAPDRKFIVNWTNVRAYSNNLRYDFQVVLYENGDIRYRYNNNTANGQSATIGLEIDDTDFVQYSYNQVSVEVSFDLLFRNLLLTLPDPIVQYRLDEVSWDGSAGEVIDSTLNNLHGRSYSGADTDNTTPALGSTIGTCNYGVFDGSNDYVEIPDNNLLDYSNNFSVGAWIKIDSIPTSGLKTILSKDENYEFHVNSSGQINWWWRTSILNQVREFNSTGTITPGAWHHVVISFTTANQKIFIDGNEAGSANFVENARTNSDPIQLASDQNTSGRYFNGDIDEVNIFDQALTSLQAKELMDSTRPCSSINLCVSSFPDGLNSHTGGTISFDLNSQLFFSPSDELYASSVTLNGSSTQRSCVSVECQANGLSVDPTTPQAFPDTSSFTSDVTINNNNTGTMGGSENQYRDISLGNNATLNVQAGFSDYYIDDISTGNNANLNLVAGTYWINNFSAGRGLDITVTGGTARVYINNSFALPRDAIINSPSSGSQGDASQFLLYGYNAINTGRNSTFSGVIYATANVELDRSSNYFGAITGADISIGRDTNVFYNPTAAANLNYDTLCQGASCNLGSFNINQPSYALACPGTRSQISIQAMCDDGTTVKDDYAGTVDLTTNENSLSEFYTSLVSVPVINSVVFDGSESGQKDVYLFHQNENPALQVITTDAAIPITSTSTNPTDFRTQGFQLTNPASFICGSSSNLTLTAIGDDETGASCQLLTGFTGVKAMKAWYQVNVDAAVGADPVTTSLSIASQLINDQVEPAANNVNVTFTNGIATVPLAYANAGQVLSVNIKHDDPPYDGSVPELGTADLSASSTSFVVRPDRIALAVTTANSVCPTADASCSRFVAAGAPFSQSLTAQCIGGATADDYQGSVNLDHSLVAPLPGSQGALSIASSTIAGVDGGSVTMANQSISEVGVFNLTAEDTDYFGQAIPAFTLTNVGRFYPDHFIMSANSVGDSCVGFSYMSQPGMTIDYSLQAQSFGSVLTQNYKGAFAKATMGLVAENNNDGGGYQARLDNTSPAVNWVNGEYDFTFTGSFIRAANPDGPFHLLQVGVQLADNDGNISNINNLDMKADTSTDCATLGECDAKRIGNLDLRFGQLTLSNVFGPEAFDLEMPVQTEYFDGSNFILNSDDNCTNLAITDPPFTPSNWADNLDAGDADPNLINNIISGIGLIRFDAAGVGNEGSVDYDYTADSWLQTENDGDGSYTDNAKGKVTFGQYRGNDRMIYWREVVQ
jgi:MSHA biogenesis protein MshQ